MIHLVHIRAHISIRSLNKFHHRLVPFSPTQGCHPGIRRKNCWRTSAIPATGTVMPHETSAEHGGTCWKRSKNIKSKLEHGVVHGPKTAWCWLEPWNFEWLSRNSWEWKIIPTDFHSIIFQRGRSTTNQNILEESENFWKSNGKAQLGS